MEQSDVSPQPYRVKAEITTVSPLYDDNLFLSCNAKIAIATMNSKHWIPFAFFTEVLI